MSQILPALNFTGNNTFNENKQKMFSEHCRNYHHINGISSIRMALQLEQVSEN